MSLTMNQCGVINNYHQQVHKYKRVITVCSGAVDQGSLFGGDQ